MFTLLQRGNRDEVESISELDYKEQFEWFAITMSIALDCICSRHIKRRHLYGLGMVKGHAINLLK